MKPVAIRGGLPFSFSTDLFLSFGVGLFWAAGRFFGGNCEFIMTTKRADGTISTDPPIDMDPQMSGSYRAAFDTKEAEPGPAFASIRAEAPPAADDIKFTIIANAANPDT